MIRRFTKSRQPHPELGKHAETLGLEISLEMYEDTYIGTADGTVRFIHDGLTSPRLASMPTSAIWYACTVRSNTGYR